MPLKVLITAAHGGLEYELSKTGFEFYRLRYDNEIPRDAIGTYMNLGRPYVDNIKDYPMSMAEEISKKVDVIIAGTHFHTPFLNFIDKPKYMIAHCLDNAVEGVKLGLNKEWQFIHICDWSKEQSGDGHGVVIYNSVTLENYQRYDPNKVVHKDTVLKICSNLKGRAHLCGYELWEQVTQGYKRIVFGGQNESINPDGKMHIRNTIESYAQLLTEYPFMLNTTLLSTMPMVISDCLASGTPIISTATGGIPEVLKHNVNALMSNDPYELRLFMDELFGNPNECQRLGNNARECAEAYFNSSRMASDYKNLLESTFGV